MNQRGPYPKSTAAEEIEVRSLEAHCDCSTRKRTATSVNRAWSDPGGLPREGALRAECLKGKSIPGRIQQVEAGLRGRVWKQGRWSVPWEGMGGARAAKVEGHQRRNISKHELYPESSVWGEVPKGSNKGCWRQVSASGRLSWMCCLWRLGKQGKSELGTNSKNAIAAALAPWAWRLPSPAHMALPHPPSQKQPGKLNGTHFIPGGKRGPKPTREILYHSPWRLV